MQIDLSFVIILVASCRAEQLLRSTAMPAEYLAKKSEQMGRMNLLTGEIMETHFINKSGPKMFVYLLQWDVPCLTITVTPCAVPVAWSVRNITASGVIVDVNLTGWIPTTYKTGTQIYELSNATKGAYQIGVAVETSGYVQIFVSIAGSVSLLRPTAHLTVTSRRQKGQLSIRWPPSSIDPHVISYWLVVNPTGPLSTLCHAQVLAGLDITFKQELVGAFSVAKKDLTVENLGNKPSAIVKGLRTDRNYSVEVYIVNNSTGFSYLYGTARTKYSRTRPLPLRDGKQTEASLKKMDGRATFRYKVGKLVPTESKLEFYIAVCGTGAAVDVELRFKRKPIIERKEVVGYSTISLDNPVPGATYILRLNSTEPEMLARISQVQVLGTVRGLREPILPNVITLHEYKSGRTCRSVLLGWVPSLPSNSPNATIITKDGVHFLTYCITTKEVHKTDAFTPSPDQCAHYLALKNHDYTTNFCFHRLINKKMITKEVTHLKPGRFYDIQVAVRQANSRVLSYEKIRVRTKPQQHCMHFASRIK